MIDEKTVLEICREVRENGTDADSVAAEIIYNNIFARDAAAYRDWNTARYQAPETREGFALGLCIYTAIQIRTATAEGR